MGKILQIALKQIQDLVKKSGGDAWYNDNYSKTFKYHRAMEEIYLEGRTSITCQEEIQQ